MVAYMCVQIPKINTKEMLWKWWYFHANNSSWMVRNNHMKIDILEIYIYKVGNVKIYIYIHHISINM